MKTKTAGRLAVAMLIIAVVVITILVGQSYASEADTVYQATAVIDGERWGFTITERYRGNWDTLPFEVGGVFVLSAERDGQPERYFTTSVIFKREWRDRAYDYILESAREAFDAVRTDGWFARSRHAQFTADGYQTNGVRGTR